jgi:hypothetical protein
MPPTVGPCGAESMPTGLLPSVAMDWFIVHP